MFKIDQTPEGERHIVWRTKITFVSPLMLISPDKLWFQFYKAAVLELDPRKLPERVVAAKDAVQLRLKEIEGDSNHHAERRQIEDALNNLRTLEREK